MRTTIDIEDDLLAAAKGPARMQNVPAGQFVSKLLRHALADGTVQGARPSHPAAIAAH